MNVTAECFEGSNMALTVEEFKKLVAEEKTKPKKTVPDPWEDWGEEIDKHPITNPEHNG